MYKLKPSNYYMISIFFNDIYNNICITIHFKLPIILINLQIVIENCALKHGSDATMLTTIQILMMFSASSKGSIRCRLFPKVMSVVNPSSDCTGGDIHRPRPMEITRSICTLTMLGD